jgi:hypothetical protein
MVSGASVPTMCWEATMSQIDDLRSEADLCRNGMQFSMARMLDKAACTIERLAKMCKQVEYSKKDMDGDNRCSWCGMADWSGHAPGCDYVVNGIAELLEEETE